MEHYGLKYFFFAKTQNVLSRFCRLWVSSRKYGTMRKVKIVFVFICFFFTLVTRLKQTRLSDMELFENDTIRIKNCFPGKSRGKSKILSRKIFLPNINLFRLSFD